MFSCVGDMKGKVRKKETVLLIGAFGAVESVLSGQFSLGQDECQVLNGSVEILKVVEVESGKPVGASLITASLEKNGKWLTQQEMPVKVTK